MRPRTLALPLLAIAALGLLAAPAVLADGDGAAAAEAGKARAAEKRAAAAETRAAHANDSDDDANRTRGERPDRANATHERPAHVTTFVERMHALRVAWNENATMVREDCRAQTLDEENSTGEEVRAYAHCIRDGYKDLRAWLVAELSAAREDFRAAHATWKGEQRAAQARAHAQDG